MRWQHTTTHPWQEPLALAATYAGADMALLYSSRSEHYTGNHSYLFLEPLEQFTGNDWAALPTPMESDLPDLVGYLGYGMGDGTTGEPSSIPLPDFALTRYGRLLVFDHKAKTITEFCHSCESRNLWQPGKEIPAFAGMTIKKLSSNFTRDEYETCIAATLKHIAAGNFYQANITRKFFGQFTETPDYFSLFARLCEVSPAPFSAYIRQGGRAIISSSPESFLQLEGGTITTRPIKGSAARGADEVRDAAIRTALATSEKNLAENLMITDLMRHDLAQVSEPGSVEVVEQSALYSYPTIHHLISTVRSRALPHTSPYDIARACFPPGSMTGAPKRAAIAWCTARERVNRGVYSGALGWFSASRCDLSVVIRTIICEGDRFEFQVGGGIVADSTPADEWRETLVKARGIARAIGIEEEQLEAL